MSQNVFRYQFAPELDTAEIEVTLVLAIIATESLHGETAAQLGISHCFDAEKRLCVIDASDQVGHDFNALFAGFLRREFGSLAFRAHRVAISQPHALAPAA